MNYAKIAKQVAYKYTNQHKKAWSFTPQLSEADKLKWHPDYFSILDLSSTEHLITLLGIYSQMFSMITYAQDSCLVALEELGIFHPEILVNNDKIEKILMEAKEKHVLMMQILTNSIRTASTTNPKDISLVSKINYEFSRLVENAKLNFSLFFKKEDLNQSSALVNLRGHYLTMLECLKIYISNIRSFLATNQSSKTRSKSKDFDSIIRLAIKLESLALDLHRLFVENHNILVNR